VPHGRGARYGRRLPSSGGPLRRGVRRRAGSVLALVEDDNGTTRPSTATCRSSGGAPIARRKARSSRWRAVTATPMALPTHGGRVRWLNGRFVQCNELWRFGPAAALRPLPAFRVGERRDDGVSCDPEKPARVLEGSCRHARPKGHCRCRAPRTAATHRRCGRSGPPLGRGPRQAPFLSGSPPGAEPDLRTPSPTPGPENGGHHGDRPASQGSTARQQRTVQHEWTALTRRTVWHRT